MKKLLTALLLSMALTSCSGYMPGQQSYWDVQVKNMCQKDGGNTVFETVDLSEEEYKHLGGMQGGLPVPHVSKDPAYPYFFEMFDSTIRNANPTVVRTEMLIRRRSDGKLLGRSVRYTRRGGDLPTGIVSDSSFSCPENNQLISQIFRVKGK